MVLLGLALLLLSGAFAGLLIAQNLSGGPEYSAAVLGFRLPAQSASHIFLAGLALAFVFSAGLWLAGAAMRRRRIAASRYREARADAATAAAQRDQLAAKLERERDNRPQPTGADGETTARHRRPASWLAARAKPAEEEVTDSQTSVARS